MEVKKKKRGRPGNSEGKLEKSGIIQRARSMILSDQKVPSIRKLAFELGVDPMAIYHYFPNKNFLLEAITIDLIDEISMSNPAFPWRKNLMTLCLSYLKLLITYPGLLQIILSIPSKGPVAIFQERFETAIEELNLSESKKGTILDLIADYLHGFALAVDCHKNEGVLIPMMAKEPLNFIFDGMV
ncbi:MAG: TetR/AcrR family transcriptional regulator [Spirochaetales bacterium]|nr:TetR/AcrR family transcriptional regulator [Spirochaetales bacterium]